MGGITQENHIKQHFHCGPFKTSQNFGIFEHKPKVKYMETHRPITY